MFGAQLQVLAGGSNLLAMDETRATLLRDSGRNVLVIPTGGSTPRGSLGYARCAAEFAQQGPELDLTFNQVVVPNGSTGTHAGLAAGF